MRFCEGCCDDRCDRLRIRIDWIQRGFVRHHSWIFTEAVLVRFTGGVVGQVLSEVYRFRDGAVLDPRLHLPSDEREHLFHHLLLGS